MYVSNQFVPPFLLPPLRSGRILLLWHDIWCRSMATSRTSGSRPAAWRLLSCPFTSRLKVSIVLISSVLERMLRNHSSLGEWREYRDVKGDGSVAFLRAAPHPPTEASSIAACSMPELKSSLPYVALYLSEILAQETMPYFSDFSTLSNIRGLFLRSRLRRSFWWFIGVAWAHPY